jgi:hypothetical protein
MQQPDRFLDEFDAYFRHAARAIGETYKSKQAVIDNLTGTEKLLNKYGEAGPRILLYIYTFLN